MMYWKRQNYEDNKKINDREREGGGMNRWNTEDLGGSENTSYDTIMMCTRHYTLVQPHSVYNTKSEPHVA